MKNCPKDAEQLVERPTFMYVNHDNVSVSFCARNSNIERENFG